MAPQMATITYFPELKLLFANQIQIDSKRNSCMNRSPTVITKQLLIWFKKFDFLKLTILDFLITIIERRAESTSVGSSTIS